MKRKSLSKPDTLAELDGLLYDNDKSRSYEQLHSDYLSIKASDIRKQIMKITEVSKDFIETMQDDDSPYVNDGNLLGDDVYSKTLIMDNDETLREKFAGYLIRRLSTIVNAGGESVGLERVLLEQRQLNNGLNGGALSDNELAGKLSKLLPGYKFTLANEGLSGVSAFLANYSHWQRVDPSWNADWGYESQLSGYGLKAVIIGLTLTNLALTLKYGNAIKSATKAEKAVYYGVMNGLITAQTISNLIDKTLANLPLSGSMEGFWLEYSLYATPIALATIATISNITMGEKLKKNHDFMNKVKSLYDKEKERVRMRNMGENIKEECLEEIGKVKPILPVKPAGLPMGPPGLPPPPGLPGAP